MRPLILTLTSLALLAGPAHADPGDELAGNSAQAVNSDGARAAIYGEDGAVRFIGAFEADQFETVGTYAVADGLLCFELEAFIPPECLTYPDDVAVGAPVEMQSSLGYAVTFVLIEGHAAVLPPA